MKVFGIVITADGVVVSTKVILKQKYMKSQFGQTIQSFLIIWSNGLNLEA